jgi:predicted nucleotidyltransferase
MSIFQSMKFPTQTHERVAELFAGFCKNRKLVDTVLVVNSCARGVAAAQSDLDLAALVKADTPGVEISELEASWNQFASRNALVAQFLDSGPYCKLHIDFFTGAFFPTVWDEGGGPDSFEIEIGNRIAHSAVLGQSGPYFSELRRQWLPYYSDELRTTRISMVRQACNYHLEYIRLLHGRRLHFHAFDQLYKAHQEFLQGVFIARQTYPIAYNKWIHEQIVEWLELPDLYDELLTILTIGDLEGNDILLKAELLHELLEHWVKPITSNADT